MNTQEMLLNFFFPQPKQIQSTLETPQELFNLTTEKAN